MKTGKGKKIRLGTPNGNVWVYPDSPKEYSNELPAPYTCMLGKVSKGYGFTVKQPMLVVGSNNHVRQNVPFFILQAYDVHLLYIPDALVHKLGCVMISRTDNTYVFVSVEDNDIRKAFDKMFLGIAREGTDTHGSDERIELPKQHDKFMVWLNHWVYRSSKISLKDVLHLTTFKEIA